MRTNCQSFQDRIADLVTGILPERDRRELETHLASCADCRAYLHALKQEDALLTEHFAGIDENMAARQQRMLQRIRCSHLNEKRKRISIWREIMRSPFSKLATAAMVLIIAAVSIVVLDRSAAPAYALTDLPAAFARAHVIHVEGRQYFPGAKDDDGKPIPPVALNSWIDLENSRTRQIGVSSSQRWHLTLFGGRTSTTVTVSEAVCNGPYLMSIDHAAKTARFTRISEYYRQWMAYQDSRTLWGQLCSQPAQLEEFVKVGREEMDGRIYDIWQFGTDEEAGNSASKSEGASAAGNTPTKELDVGPIPRHQSKLWIAVDTGRLSRAQVLSRASDGSWQLERDYRTIDYDVTPPEDTFTLEPPVGYSALNAKETAGVAELPGGTVSAGGSNCRARVSFTLSDGSMIFAWQSRRQGSTEAQEPLFANLTFGGPLPKLPIEVYGLKSTRASGVTYTGRHLGWTRKSGQLIEWALYVPDTTPPAGVKYGGYNLLFRYNDGPSPLSRASLTVGYGIPIKTAEDFDKWVRGAMAEFSDSGAPPADMTYQKVCDLARQLRTSIRR